MPDIPELHLRQSSSSISDDVDTGEMRDVLVDDRLVSDEQTKWILLILLFVISAAVVGYVVYRRQKATTPQAVAAPVSAPAPAPAAKPTTGPLVQAENIPLPPLAETDALVR